MMETTNNARTGMFTTNAFNSSKVTDFEKNKIKLKKIKVNAKRTEKVLTGLFVSFTGYIFLLAIFIPYITISITSIVQQYLSKWKRIFTFIQKYLYTLYSSEHSYKKRNFKFFFPGALLLVTGGTGTIIGALVMSAPKVMSVALIEPFDRWFQSLSKGSGATRRNYCYTKCGGFDKLNHRNANLLDSPTIF